MLTIMTLSKPGTTQYLFLILLLASSIIHFYHIDHPEHVVFDEVHFGSYIDAYCCSGKRFFDIHPPHAKLIIAGIGKLLGYQGGQDFKKINTFFSGSDAIALRFFPALCGALLSPIIFLLILQLGGSTTAALVAGLLIIFDNALLVQTRLILLDGPLLLGTFLSLLTVLFASKQKQLWKRYLFFLISGISAALAVGSKFTGLVSLFLPFIIAIVDIIKQKSWQNAKQWLMAALIFLTGFSSFYLFGWYLHFELLKQPGPGDIWGVLNGSFFENIIHIHKTMLSANANLTATHPDMSMWWGWPWMHSPLFYWVDKGRAIYLVGNPLIWWLISLLFITFIVLLLLMKISNLIIKHNTDGHSRPQFWLVLTAYAASFFPLIAVSRPLFLYHYFTPLIFSIIFVSLWLEYIGWLNTKNLFKQRISVYIMLLLIIVSFYLILPISYGLVDSIETANSIFKIFPSWR